MAEILGFTDWFILGSILAIVGVDIALVSMERPTVSKRLRFYGERVAAFPFAWGALGGHYWGPSHGPIGGNWVTSVTLLILCTFGAVVGHRWLRLVFNMPRWFAVFWLLPGIAAGAIFWPQ